MIEKLLEMIYNLTMGTYDYMTSVRRALHKIPERSGMENATSDYIYAELCSMGYKPKRIATGMICDVRGENSRRKIALRADIDALPIVEKNDCDYKSVNGCMHACGHDGHTAMLLYVAKELRARKPLTDVRLIFQYGEEGEAGAQKMMEKGAIDGVDEIYAFHLCPELDVGKVASCDGAMFAGVVEFDVEFTGKSSHCADKDSGIDALAASAEFTVGSREVNADCSKNTLFHIGAIESGSARNIVADKALLKCTLRYFDSADTDKLMMRLERMLIGCDNKFGTEHRLTVHAVYPPLVNNPAALARLRSITEIGECAPKFTAEDFSFYLEKIPGCMCWLGCGDDRHRSPLHSDTFDFDERALSYGVTIYEKLLFGK